MLSKMTNATTARVRDRMPLRIAEASSGLLMIDGTLNSAGFLFKLDTLIFVGLLEHIDTLGGVGLLFRFDTFFHMVHWHTRHVISSWVPSVRLTRWTIQVLLPRE